MVSRSLNRTVPRRAVNIIGSNQMFVIVLSLVCGDWLRVGNIWTRGQLVLEKRGVAAGLFNYLYRPVAEGLTAKIKAVACLELLL